MPPRLGVTLEGEWEATPPFPQRAQSSHDQYDDPLLLAGAENGAAPCASCDVEDALRRWDAWEERGLEGASHSTWNPRRRARSSVDTVDSHQFRA